MNAWPAPLYDLYENETPGAGLCKSTPRLGHAAVSLKGTSNLCLQCLAADLGINRLECNLGFFAAQRLVMKAGRHLTQAKNHSCSHCMHASWFPSGVNESSSASQSTTETRSQPRSGYYGVMGTASPGIKKKKQVPWTGHENAFVRS